MQSRLMVFLSALGGAILLGAAGYALGALIGRLTGGGMADLALGVAGMVLGVALGNGLGASWAAKREKRERKAWVFWALGAGAVVFVLLLAEPLGLNQHPAGMLIALLGVPALVESLAA